LVPDEQRVKKALKGIYGLQALDPTAARRLQRIANQTKALTIVCYPMAWRCSCG
jgi:hypothetical protein